MYDMVRKVMTPARISVLMLEPRSDILKNLCRHHVASASETFVS